MAKHRLYEESTTGSHKALSTATVIVLASGSMVLVSDTAEIPKYTPSESQPIVIPPVTQAAVIEPVQVGEFERQVPLVPPSLLQQAQMAVKERQAPATTVLPPLPRPTPKPTPAKRVQTQNTAPIAPADTSLIAVAQRWLAKRIPYLFGGATLRGMDCSHFVWEVLKEAGYNVPYRNSYALKAWTIPITKAEAKPGDLVFWPGHVGFYAGNNQTIDHGSGIGPKLRNLWGTPSFGRIP